MGKMLRCLAKFYGFVTLPFPCALLAQLDRASDYESEGRRFESPRAHQFFTCFYQFFLPVFLPVFVVIGELAERLKATVC